MSSNHDHSSPPIRLLESDPNAYFEKFLQELNDLEDWIDGRDDKERSMPEDRRQRASRR